MGKWGAKNRAWDGCVVPIRRERGSSMSGGLPARTIAIGSRCVRETLDCNLRVELLIATCARNRVFRGNRAAHENAHLVGKTRLDAAGQRLE